MDEQNVQTEGIEETTPDTETQTESHGTAEGEAQPEAAPESGNESGTEGEGNAENTNGQTAQEPAPAAEEGGNPAPYLTVRFNHEDRQLSEDEARRLAQLGMRYESVHSRLDYGAALAGVSVDKFVEDAISAPEKEYRRHLEELYGEDSEDVEIGMNIWREKRKADYQKVIDERTAQEKKNAEQAQADINTRLAEEYLELKAEIPGIAEYEKLPDSVIKEAASGKRDLLSAYLRWERNENKKITAAKKTEAAANDATAGKQGDNGDGDSSVSDALISGIWGK